MKKKIFVDATHVKRAADHRDRFKSLESRFAGFFVDTDGNEWLITVGAFSRGEGEYHLCRSEKRSEIFQDREPFAHFLVDTFDSDTAQLISDGIDW